MVIDVNKLFTEDELEDMSILQLFQESIKRSFYLLSHPEIAKKKNWYSISFPDVLDKDIMVPTAEDITFQQKFYTMNITWTIPLSQYGDKYMPVHDIFRRMYGIVFPEDTKKLAPANIWIQSILKWKDKKETVDVIKYLPYPQTLFTHPQQLSKITQSDGYWTINDFYYGLRHVIDNNPHAESIFAALMFFATGENVLPDWIYSYLDNEEIALEILRIMAFGTPLKGTTTVINAILSHMPSAVLVIDSISYMLQTINSYEFLEEIKELDNNYVLISGNVLQPIVYAMTHDTVSEPINLAALTRMLETDYVAFSFINPEDKPLSYTIMEKATTLPVDSPGDFLYALRSLQKPYKDLYVHM